jgi:hypothetical protein
VPKSFEQHTSNQALCAHCGIPIDAKYFDESGVASQADLPKLGNAVVLARFELPPMYCGVLEYFSQFTNLCPKDPSEIVTPDFEWTILSNGHPLYPYIHVDRILNPWGFGSFPVAIRLDENVKLEFVVRRVSNTTSDINKVGGRLLGRYWYNVAYGDLAR